MRKLVFDIEGNGLGEITIGSKGPVPEVSKLLCGVALDVDTQEVKTFTDVLKLVQHLNTADLLIGHNILGYDIPVLNRLSSMPLKKPSKGFFDTLIVSKLMYPDRNDHPLGGNSLENWGKHLKNEKLNYTGGWESFSEDMLKYCIQDVKLGYQIYQAQQSYVNNNYKVFQFEHLVSEVLMKQTEQGFSYDLTKGEEFFKTLLLEKVVLEDQMRTIFPDKTHFRVSVKTGNTLKPKIEVFNPGSRQQIASRLHEKYGWVVPLTDKGNPKVDESVLSLLSYPEAKELLKYFTTVKLMGMVQDWNTRAGISRDGRIHGFVNGQGAATGRCTHSEPNIAQVSGDPRTRELWTPHKGMIQLGADLSGLELRMLAHFMYKYDQGKYAEIVLHGDIHTYNQKAAGLPTREMAKLFIYAYLYGASDRKIASIVSCSIPEATNLREKFLKEIPALTKVQNEIKYLAIKHKALGLPDGRTIPVRSEHAALNTLLQGSGAIVSKYWMVLADRELQRRFKSKVFQMAYIHDELQYSVQSSIADEVGNVVISAATEAGKRLGIKIPINAEYKIGKNWADTH